MADPDGETMPHWPGAADGRVTGPAVQDVGRLMQLVALGRMVALVTESAASRPHRGVVYRPVSDAPTATIVVAWAQQSRSRQVAAFVAAARATATQ
jgi:DNA-binding transcriptional LysR family regulator